MFRRTNYSRIGLFLIITILFFMNQFNFLTFTYTLPVEGSSNDPLIILFDQGHGQFFNASIGRFSQAIEALQLNNNTIVRFSNNRLNTSILSGVDILIITNPKADTDYSTSEEDAIKTWFDRGNKGLFLLSNPYLEDNKTLSGNSAELKNLITGSYLSIPDVNLAKNIIKLDSSSMNDTSILTLNTDYSDHWIFNQTALVNRTITQSCSVKASERVLIAGREAYAEDSLGVITLQDETPEIISLTTYLNTSRLVLSGSTIMFSDLPFNSTHSWYEVADNSILWKNIITWLGDVIPQEEVELSPPLDPVQVIIAVSASAGITLIVGFFLHISGVLRPASATPTSAPLPTQRPKKEKETEPEKPTRVKRLSRRQRQLKAEREKREPKKTPPKKKSRRQRQLDQRKKKAR